MLKSLENTGTSGRLNLEQETHYKKVVSDLESEWKKSICSMKSIPSCSLGISSENIPTPTCQFDYYHIIFDSDGCCNKSKQKANSDKKTMADGGTIPCALISILKYYGYKTDLLELGQILVSNEYVNADGKTKLLAINKVPEKFFNLETVILTSVFQIFDALCGKHPVIALVSFDWLHRFSLRETYECTIIWSIEDNKAVITTTSSHSTLKVDFVELLKNIKMVWECKPLY